MININAEIPPEPWDDVPSTCRVCGLPMEQTLGGIALCGKNTATCDECIEAYEATVNDEKLAEQWRGVVPPQFIHTDINHPDFNITAYQKMRAVPFGGKSMVLVGETGRCKTRSMIYYTKIAFSRGSSFRILWPEEFKEEAYKKAKLQWLKNMTAYDIVACDDLFTAGAASETVADLIKDLIDRRMRYNKQTIITSQLSAKEIKADASKWSSHTGAEGKRVDAILRRLRDFEVIPFDEHEHPF